MLIDTATALCLLFLGIQAIEFLGLIWLVRTLAQPVKIQGKLDINHSGAVNHGGGLHLTGECPLGYEEDWDDHDPANKWRKGKTEEDD